MSDKEEKTNEVRKRNNTNVDSNHNAAKSKDDANIETSIYGNLQLLRDRVEHFKANLVSTLDEKLSDSLDDFLIEIEKLEHIKDSRGEKASLAAADKKLDRKDGELPDKQFIPRRSVLTELLDISHIRSIYHIFVAILIVFSLHTIVKDILDRSNTSLQFELIIWGFGKLPLVICLWLCMMAFSTAFLYPFFQNWAKFRTNGNLRLTDLPWMGIYGIYMIAFLVIPCYYVHSHSFPIASAVVCACEQVRLIMKQHAFIRENLERALEKGVVPDFSRYLYFLFIPTLVYRDEYPRTRVIRWNYVVSNLAQVVACLLYVYYIFLRFVAQLFSKFSNEHMNTKNLILSCFACMLPASLMLFIAFFAILHSWMNAWAEMLTFADRLFYRDWWNSRTFSNYYRTWNVVVHDWLYTYVYKDAVTIFGKYNRAAAMSTVFLLSAVVHEFILVVSFGFFYPVLFVLFMGAGFGLMFIKGKNQKWNIGMWVALFMGTGILLYTYSLEWYARKLCPNVYTGIKHYVIPRSWIACKLEN